MIRRLLGVTAALLGIAWLVWLLTAGSGESASPEVVTERPRYQLQDVRWLRMDEQGRLLYVAVAKDMRLFTDGSAQVWPVVVDQLGAGDVWRLRAPFGELPAQGDVLSLRDGVRLHGHWRDGRPLVGETERLDVITARRELYTDEPVLLRGSQERLEARGLRADWTGDRIHLLHDVRTQYDRPS